MRPGGSRLWAWMTEEPDGQLSLIGMMVDNVHAPMIGRDEKIIRGLEPIARKHGNKTGQAVWLRCWISYRDEEDLDA